MEYTLPEGFEWVSRRDDYLEFRHIESDLCGAISHCERATTPDGELQGSINYACARLVHHLNTIKSNQDGARR